MTDKEKKQNQKGDGSGVSPLMQQYFLIKEKYPEELVFFQVGDFYELFFSDAQIAAKILGVALTKRGQYDGKDIPLCGVPVHMAEHYYPKLLKHDYTVVICDQVEAAQPGKIVHRAVVDIITPSTLCTSEATDTAFSLYIVEKENIFYCFWFAFLEQKITYASYKGDNSGFILLKAALKKYLPREIIVKKEQCEFFWRFFEKKQFLKAFAITVFDVEKSLSSYRLPVVFTDLMRLFMSYMTFYFQRIIDRENIFFEEDKSDLFLFLDESTITYLELTDNVESQEKNRTLWKFLDRTETKMGSRLLRRWILYPLRNADEIQKRQNVISLLLENLSAVGEMKKFLHLFGDLERFFQRARLRKITDKEYIKFFIFKKNYESCIDFIAQDGFCFQSFFDPIPEAFFSAVDHYINGNETLIIDHERVIINPHATPELIHYYRMVTDQKTILADFVSQEKERTGIEDLVIKLTPLYGYTFELSKVKEKQHSLPSYFSRVQTLTNKERYTTPELQRLSYDLTDALMSYREEEKKAKEMFMSICLSFQHDLLHFASSVAMIDVLIAAAESAHEEKWIKPQIVSAGMSLLIKDGKHPIIASQNHYFVSNTLALSEKKTVLLTGPNMGGKSTFMRQNALIIILAHIGFFVPASLVEIPIMDNIFTRIGASDSAEEGKSTFFVELEEVNRIITYASRFSFVIIDEIGRGTSTYDGIALAASIISFLLDEKKPYMICSTHYHELADFIDEKKVSWGYMGYHMTKEHIQFLYTLLPGIAQQSMGIALAEKIGLPKMITSQARQYVDALEKKSFLIDQKNNNQNKKSEENICSLSSKGLKETLKKIGAVDIDDLTPRKAFDLIAELKNTIDISLFEKD